jgi:hypothetical protein
MSRSEIVWESEQESLSNSRCGIHFKHRSNNKRKTTTKENNNKRKKSNGIIQTTH